MAHKSYQPIALADIYAESLLSAAAEQGREDAVAEEFAELIRYMDGHPEFEQFLTAESVDDDPRRASLEKIFRGRISDLLLNLLQVMNNRWRLGLVREVYRQVELRMAARRDEQEVIVETAMALTVAQKDAIRETVGAQIGKKVILIEKVRPELIGGVVIRVEDIQVDASTSSQLMMMRRRLKERATEEIHSGRGYVVEA